MPGKLVLFIYVYCTTLVDREATVINDSVVYDCAKVRLKLGHVS
jgi:hypothetical protein